MENLIPIGRFSKMTRLTVKALRRYDELGLLTPAVVDPSSGYRYYRYGQANRAEAIKMLRRLDLPYARIRELLQADDPEIVDKLLHLHREHLESELDRHRRMLAFIGRLIERKEGVMPYDVRVKTVPATYVASIHRHTTMRTIGTDVQECFGAIGQTIGMAGLQVTGPPYLVTFDVIDEDTDGDVALAFPVASAFEDRGDVRCEEVPETTVAWTVHLGPYDEVGPAYHTVAGWIQEHGHEIAGPPREVYLTDPGETSDPAEYETEVQFPIR